MTISNEDDVLAVVGPRRAPIVVRLNEFKGKRTVDFRRYFYAENKEDLLPTQKGVSFDRECFALVKAAINDNGERIEEWLTTDTGRTLSRDARAVEQLQSELRPHTSDREQWKSPAFFHVKAEGAVDHLTLNAEHAVSAAIESLCGTVDAPQAMIIRMLIAGILISYYRSKMLFDGVAEMSAKDIFETLELNWGIVLKRYAEQVQSEAGNQ
jgi:hypothetical protein